MCYFKTLFSIYILCVNFIASIKFKKLILANSYVGKFIKYCCRFSSVIVKNTIHLIMVIDELIDEHLQAYEMEDCNEYIFISFNELLIEKYGSCALNTKPNGCSYISCSC